MQLANTQLLPRPIATTWNALLDPAVLRECIPGCEELESTGENAYRIVMRAKVGPVAAKFNGSLQITDLDEPNGYTVTFTGQAGAVGFGKGSARVSLAPEAEGTRISYTVQATVGGKIAQVGSRLVDSAAMMIAKEFFERFEEQLLQQRPTSGAPTEAKPARAETRPSSAGSWWTASSPRWYLGATVLIVLVLAAAAVLSR